VTMVGGFDPAATGTVTEWPTYPSATPTVFDGDANNSGKADQGDVKALMRVEFGKNDDKKITIQGIDFINTYNDETESPEDIKTAMNECAALRLICGTAFVKNCHFYNHITPCNRGSQCVTSIGAKLHMTDCEVHDCVSMTRGSLLRLRNYFIDEDTNKTQKPECVLERCSFYNGNNMGGKTMDNNGFYGGGIQVSYGYIFAINCTFANNTGYSDGGGMNGNESGVSLISCTFVNNQCMRAQDADVAETGRNTYGSNLHFSKDGPLNIANTFILDDLDNSTKQYATTYTGENTKAMTEICLSGGYNVLGTVFYYQGGKEVSEQNAVWKPSDLWTVVKSNTAQKYATYFGTNKEMQDNGGFSKTILPLKMQDGAKVADLQTLANKLCPTWTKVDATVDQRGLKRDESITCVGAAAYEAAPPSAINEIKSASFNLQSSIYNILGQPVNSTYKGIVIQNGKKLLLQ